MSKSKGGRTSTLTNATRAKIVKAMTTTTLTVKQISEKYGVPVSTMYYHRLGRKQLLAA